MRVADNGSGFPGHHDIYSPVQRRDAQDAAVTAVSAMTPRTQVNAQSIALYSPYAARLATVGRSGEEGMLGSEEDDSLSR